MEWDFGYHGGTFLKPEYGRGDKLGAWTATVSLIHFLLMDFDAGFLCFPLKRWHRSGFLGTGAKIKRRDWNRCDFTTRVLQIGLATSSST